HTRDREETCLHDRVDARAHAGVLCDSIRVDHVETQILRNDLPLHVWRQRSPHRVGVEWRVQEKHRALFCRLEDVVPSEKTELMAPDKRGSGNEIWRANRLGPETQMRDRDRTRFLRVVDKVRLCE